MAPGFPAQEGKWGQELERLEARGGSWGGGRAQLRSSRSPEVSLPQVQAPGAWPCLGRSTCTF